MRTCCSSEALVNVGGNVFKAQVSMCNSYITLLTTLLSMVFILLDLLFKKSYSLNIQKFSSSYDIKAGLENETNCTTLLLN